MSKCSLCKGEGKRIIVIKSTITNRMKTIAEWCICVKSKYISQIYDMVESLKDTYLPLEKIDKKLVFKPEELLKSPNLFIINTNWDTFCLNIKSFLIKHRFLNDPPSIHLCRAIEILKKFWVQQEDGSSPSLLNLNRYDLIIFTLDTKEKNDQLGTCIAQVVYNRLCAGKPTWIYLPENTALENTREYTDDLKSFLDPKTTSGKKFVGITLTNTKVKVKATKTLSQNKAEGFAR